MQIGVLASPDSWYCRDLQRAARQSSRMLAVEPLSFGTMMARVGRTAEFGTAEHSSLSRFDLLLVRTMPPGTLEQIVFRMNALHRLAAQGTRVLNPARCLEVAIDKYLALAELHAAGLPVPETRVTQQWQQAMHDFELLGRDVVIKPMFGSEGRGILRVTDEETAWRVFRSLTQLGHLIYQQAFIAHPGWDVRVLKIGKQLFGIRRINPHDFRTNVSQGGTTAPLEIDSRLNELANRSASAIGAEFVGVDILRGKDGKDYVLEVNAVPGWRAVARTLNIDIARRMLEFAVART